MALAIFDLDMTLVDSSELEQYRTLRDWGRVRCKLDRVRPFDLQAQVAPHEVPALLQRRGIAVAIVTSSPGWYAKKILAAFSIPFDTLVAYEDSTQHKPDPAPLELAMQRLSADRAETLYVGDDAIDVEASHRAGIRCVGALWRHSANPGSCTAFRGYAPGILLWSPHPFLNGLDLGPYELLGERLSSHKKAAWHRGSTMLWQDNGYFVHSLGRYVKTDDSRHFSHEWSRKILTLKDDDRDAKLMGTLLAIWLNRIDFCPTAIVPVPPKPARRNRFTALLDHAQHAFARKVSVHCNDLEWIRDIGTYKKMGAAERRGAVRGAIRARRKWQGRVLLLDDVYTTGATTKECVQVLRASGADEVIAVVLGCSQHSLDPKSCPQCGRNMRVRTNRATGEQFWGCTGFPDHCSHTIPFDRRCNLLH